jgi:hypothetical protein
MLVTGLVVLALAAAGCGGSTAGSRSASPDGSSAASASAASGPGSPAPDGATAPAPGTSVLPPGAADPNAPEIVQPGDIPDNQVFVTVDSPDGSFSVDVPEGWTRSDDHGVITCTDHYNSIAIASTPGAAAPTTASVRATGLQDVSPDPTFVLGDISPVTRRAGPGVRATFEIGSTPNPVTGKKALLAVERYFFSGSSGAGPLVVLTLSGAKGADNVDPWRTVTDSLKFR